MRTRLERAIRDESGKVFILVLALLVVGGLILGPVLGLMSTGLSAGHVYEKKTHELYAADAGVEDALWKLQHPDESKLPLGDCGDEVWTHDYTVSEVNGKRVDVTIRYLSAGIFEITSTASDNAGGSTKILSYVHATYHAEDGVGKVGEGVTVHATGNLTVDGNIEGDAVVYVEGDLTVGGNIENNARVYVKGDLTVNGNAAEDDVILCVGGDLTINKIEDGAEVYVDGNLTAYAIEGGAGVCVKGSITVDRIEKKGEAIPIVCAGGDLTVTDKIEGGYVYVGGITSVYGENEPTESGFFGQCTLCCDDCDNCCECPLGDFPTGGSAEADWGDWTLASYSIVGP